MQRPTTLQTLQGATKHAVMHTPKPRIPLTTASAGRNESIKSVMAKATPTKQRHPFKDPLILEKPEIQSWLKSSYKTRGWSVGLTCVVHGEALLSNASTLCKVLSISDKQADEKLDKNFPVFVDGMFPGETADVILVAIHDSHAVGKVDKVVTEARYRKKPPCPHYGVCGGCNLQHMGYKQQINFKQHVIKTVLKQKENQLNLMDTTDKVLRPIIASSQQWQYRTKLSPISKRDAKTGEFILGHMARDTAELINVEKCDLATKAIQAAYERHRSLLPQLHPDSAKLLPHVFRESLLPPTGSKRTDITSKVQGRGMYPPPPLRIVENGETVTRAWKKFIVTDSREQCLTVINGLVMRFVANSFFQVNPWIASHICVTIGGDFKNYKKANVDVLVDAYCGSGLLGISAARHFGTVYGIESDITGANWAALNAKTNNVLNYRCICGKVEEALQQVRVPGSRMAMVVNPPATGCTPAFLERVAAIEPRMLLYLSCNVETQMRDLAMLNQLAPKAWKLVKVQVFDMFPQTSRHETLATLVHTSLLSSPSS